MAEPRTAPPLSATARTLVAERPVFDAHVDSIQKALDCGQDLGVAGPGHLDLVRGRAGGLSSVVMVNWVDPAYIDGQGGARERTRLLLGQTHELAGRHHDQAALVGNGRALAAARAAGKVALIPGIEGGHSLEGDLEALGWFFEHGVRVLTLVWNNHLDWIRSCQDGAGAGVPDGLSEFGREVVREMNRLGVLVDLSHAGEASFRDALEASAAPVIASHSGCRALHDHPRNLTDEQLRALAANGGVVGIVFHPGFLDADARAEETRVRESDAYAALAGGSETELFVRQQEHMLRSAAPMPASRLVEHVLHAVEVAGIEHVGLGSDYDGILRGPEWLEDSSCYGTLAELLLRAGLGKDDVRAVLGGNMERVFAAATGPGTVAWEAEIASMAG